MTGVVQAGSPRIAPMETDTELLPGGSAPMTMADVRARLGRIEVFSVGLAAIIALQAIWQTILIHSGWYYQADFDNLASATGHPLNWSYLSTSQGGHLDIVGRLVLWALNRTIPLNYGATIWPRVIASAVVTYLLGRLLRELIGPRRGVLALIALFALSPMLVQSTLWLTSSINFLISELLILAALRSHVRYALTSRLWWAAWTALAILGATLVAEQAAVTALALPLLTFGFLSEGGVRDRLRAVLRSWPEWTMIAVPIIAFAAFYFGSGKYATKSGGFGAVAAIRLVGAFLFDTLIPGLFGGPIAWSTAGGNYFAFAAAPLAARIVAVALLVLAIAWTVRRTGVRALVGWAIPFLVSAVGMVFVGRARVEFFGEAAVSRHFEYASYIAIPAAVGIALAIWPTSVSDIRTRVEGGVVPYVQPAQRHGRHGYGQWGGRAVVACLVVLSLISAITYANHWSQSPSRAYVHRLSGDLAKAGDDATVFNTYVANDVMPGIDIHRRVSDLLALMGSDAHLNNGPVPAQVVNDRGNLVKAGFLTSASVHMPTGNRFCNDLLTGETTKTQRLDSIPHPNGWFVRLTYFQQVPTFVDVHLVTANGALVSPLDGSQVLLPGHYGYYYLAFPLAAPTAVQVKGLTPGTNVCLTDVGVGYPFPAG
jgi:hypothetical protein